MNETLKTIAGRYSCRDFADTPLTDEQVKALAEAALAAPSGMNRQPWHIIMVTDKPLIDELDTEGMKILAAHEDKSIYERMISRGGKVFYNAPCMIIVASDDAQAAALDCGIVTQNIALAAHSLGLGNIICGSVNIPLSGSRGQEFKKRLKFPEAYGFVMGILAGTANSGKEPHELDLAKVTYIGPLS